LIEIDFAKRLKDVIGNESVHSFAKRTGISDTVMRKYLSGEAVPGLDKAVNIAQTTNVSLEWLATGSGERSPRHVPILDAQDALDKNDVQNFVAVPIMNVTASCGGGAAVLSEDQVGVIKFDRAWLYNTWHLNPSDLFTMPTMGESMEPTIKAGEYILVSRSESHIAPGDGIYVIRLEGDILVKRLQRLPGGKLIISSDNTTYRPYEIQLDEGVDFAILGKVMLVHGIRRV